MPTINVSKQDMEKLLGKKLPNEISKLNGIFQYVGGEVESLSGDDIQLEIKCRNRPDLWCAEGIARELKGALEVETGLAQYKIKPSKRTLYVDKNLRNIRPLIAAAVIRDIHVTEELLLQMIQLQEKVCMTYGRKRRAAAMGIYDYDKVLGDIYYRAALPSTKFTPLEFDREMTLRQILQRHPKGQEYGALLSGFKRYPLVADSQGNVLSMPPIINSNYSGKVTDETRNLFIEVTGFDWETVHTSLLIAVSALADRGGKIESVRIKYSDETIVTPNFKPTKRTIKVKDINKRLGLDLTPKDVAKLLEKARYNAKPIGNAVALEIPAYRADILHDVDVIEDVAIMFGYSNFKPQELDLATAGSLKPLTKFSNKVRELMVGFGAQEVQTFTLVSGDILTSKVNRKSKLIKVKNPMSSSYEYLRDSIWPMLIDFLGKNTNQEYPQKIFEVGEVVIPNARAETKSNTVKKLAFAIAQEGIGFTDAKQVVLSLFGNLGILFEVKETEDLSFIPGRAGKIIVNNKSVGLVGEVAPEVIANFGIEMPIVIFEVDLEKIM